MTSEGHLCELTLKEFELLVYLMENQSRVVTRDELLNQVWGYEYDGETRTLDMHIRTLRQKLGDGNINIRGCRLLRCIRKETERGKSMRKAILEKFIFVLLAALCIDSVIFYIASRNTIGYNKKRHALHHGDIWMTLRNLAGQCSGWREIPAV